MMNFKEIQELIRLINKSNISEFNIKDGEFRLIIRTNQYSENQVIQQVIQPNTPMVAVSPTPAMQPAAAPMAVQMEPTTSSESAKPAPVANIEASRSNLLAVKSPIVGTFYRSSSPDKPPYVKVGDKITAGSVVCIVEAMKLFNEIESDVTGTIVEVMIEDASPVEYDQVLFLVDPTK